MRRSPARQPHLVADSTVSIAWLGASILVYRHGDAVLNRHVCESADCLPASAGDLFVPFMFLMFNGGDLLGRGLASLGPWAVNPPPTAVLLTYALSRVSLLAGLMFCNVVTPHQWRLPLVIRSVAVIRIAPSETV